MDLYSQESEDLTSPQNGWGGPTCSTANRTSSGSECSDTIGHMQSASQTSPNQISLLTEIESQSSQEAFLASRTAQQASDLAKQMTATSGRICLEQFGRFSRVGLWEKTFAGLLIGTTAWYSTKCKLTWKLKGTKSNRFYFQLQVSTLPTEETEFGLLPTPAAQDPGWRNRCPITKDGNTPTHPNQRFYDKETGRLMQKGLQNLVYLGMLPTPTTDSVSMRTKRYAQGGLPLSMAVQMLPTPNASDHPGKNTGKRNQDSIPKRIREAGGKTSQLNSRFVAEMMGFPVDWTELPFQSGETKA
jgi:hypothetical protein